MITDICMNIGWRDCVEMNIDEDIIIKANIDRDSFEEALDNIADDISEWIYKQVKRWLEQELDFEDTDMTEEEAKAILAKIEKVRP